MTAHEADVRSTKQFCNAAFFAPIALQSHVVCRGW